MVEEAKIFSKFLLCIIEESIKVKESNTAYKFISIEENKVVKIEFIASIIVWVIVDWSKITSF